MVGKSSMSDNLIDGSLEVGKWTWREGVKLQSKRLEEKKMLWINTKEISYSYISQIKWIQMLSPNGPKWTKMNRSGLKGPK